MFIKCVLTAYAFEVAYTKQESQLWNFILTASCVIMTMNTVGFLFYSLNI